MMFSYGRPTPTITLVGTGASFLTDSSALVNGRPGDPTMLQWLSTGSPDITDYVEIQFAWLDAIVLRCLGLIMPNIAAAIPPGVKIEFYGNTGGGFTYDLGGNTQDVRTAVLASGAAAVWCVTSGNGSAACSGASVRIYNDQEGATWATSSTIVALGEVWYGRGADFLLRENFKEKLMGGLTQRQSHNNQAWPLLVQPWRSLALNLQPMSELVCLGPNPAQDDFQTVVNIIGTSPACVVLPSYLQRFSNAAMGPGVIDSSTIDVQRLQRLTRLGVIDTPPEIDGDDNQFYISPISHGESAA